MLGRPDDASDLGGARHDRLTASNLGSGPGVGRTYTNQYTSPGDHTKHEGE